MPIIEIQDRHDGVWPQSSVPPKPKPSKKQQEAIDAAEAIVARAQRAHDALQAAASDEARRAFNSDLPVGETRFRWDGLVITDGQLLEGSRRVYAAISAYRWQVTRQVRRDLANGTDRRLPAPPADLVRRIEALEFEANIMPGAS